ncbi:protein-L-isoaspartate O-methyltransferase family protein [Undibacterium griseum]|uniref:Protein-L-isoaspartate O-methyltransferase n=1 Tax=Undibacterium griseum TaxID=2762295 RepID=A0ABR6YK29_9BURK|nr:protein-L-isoaspartate O-methyltransferase [Undibacterium griseum]MBC3884255.1 protein-L-isoaspartate O-methyltransferase [Undibacterium griseum]
MNIEKARFNMIEQQIRPWNVLDKDILDMLIVVKRENYFPEAQKSLAFFDTELPLPGGAKAMSPKLEARIVQELGLKKQESVLLIGAASGYLAALLAHMTRHVTVLETSPLLKELAEKNLAANGVRNVSVLLADGIAGQHAGSYDVIVVAGALESIPEQLKKQLNVNGRLLAIVGQLPVMRGVVVTRQSDAGFDSREVFDTVVPPAPGAVASSAFHF